MEPATTDQKNKICQILEWEPHRAFTAEAIVTSLRPTPSKDPQQQQQFVIDVKTDLSKLVEEGRIREVAEGLFKAKLFTNETKQIEHVYLGGMGNTLFRFRSPIFRLNIGVISLFFIKSQKKGSWMVLVRDTTAGNIYCLRVWLKDGTYRFGSQPDHTDPNYIPIVGRYIEKQHVVVVLQGEDVHMEDLKTARGSRVDLLTEEGLSLYREESKKFLKAVDPAVLWEPVSRGRYVLDQLLHHHINLEATFFGAVVDSTLLQNSTH